MVGVMSCNQTRDVILKKVLAWGLDPEVGARYPDHTHFFSADDSLDARAATKALRDGNPVVLVYSDGHELLICPEPDGGARLEVRDLHGLPMAA